MFNDLRAFLGSFMQPHHPPLRPHDDPRVSAAALLFQVMDADGVRDEAERLELRKLLTEVYALDEDGLQELLMAGEEAEAEAVDLHGFTSVLMRHWDEDERVTFVGLLWDMVFADGMLHELEDHVVWRISDLLGIDSRDRVIQRKAAARRHADALRGEG